MRGIHATGHLAAADVTLGILAGGRASRLGGLDKAWLERDGVPQVVRWQRRFAGQVGDVLVSANRDLQRYADAGLQAVPDAHAGLGPVGGLHALLQACAAPWLLTLPVDLVDVNDCLLPSLAAAAGRVGAWAKDAEGRQPLVALWPVVAARRAVAQAIGRDALSVQELQSDLGMQPLRLPGIRFGNLNTMADLRAAGVQSDA